jgi:hypothetical protein
MKTFVKCTFCDAEITDKCVFATQKRVIDGAEYVFCCERCFEVHKKKA